MKACPFLEVGRGVYWIKSQMAREVSRICMMSPFL